MSVVNVASAEYNGFSRASPCLTYNGLLFRVLSSPAPNANFKSRATALPRRAITRPNTAATAAHGANTATAAVVDPELDPDAGCDDAVDDDELIVVPFGYTLGD